jgi:hypothetical protein
MKARNSFETLVAAKQNNKVEHPKSKPQWKSQLSSNVCTYSAIWFHKILAYNSTSVRLVSAVEQVRWPGSSCSCTLAVIKTYLWHRFGCQIKTPLQNATINNQTNMRQTPNNWRHGWRRVFKQGLFDRCPLHHSRQGMSRREQFPTYVIKLPCSDSPLKKAPV